MDGAQYEDQQSTQQPNQVPYTGPPYEQPARRSDQHKSPALAMFLSCMPGLGQVYVGYYSQGFTNIAIAATTITILASSVSDGLKPFFGVCLAFFWIYNMIDANRRAHHYNRIADGLGGEEVPSDFQLPGLGGSMFGGVALVVVGVLIVLDLNFDVSLAWIKDWWPLAMIVFGGRLIYKARQKAE